jgi:hypothetical protein
MPTLASVLVLTEDAASDGPDTLAALFRHVVRDLDANCQAHRIDFEPLQNKEARRVLRGNVWKSTRAQDQSSIRTLRASIVEKLLEHPAGFVIFHVDGDTRWSSRGESENEQKFEERIRLPVSTAIKELLSGKQLSESEQQAQHDEALRRLFVLVPFYSIESWLYQNTRRAMELCDEHHGGQDRDLFAHWQQHRGELDELLRPKEATCLKAGHNQELARAAFPVAEVYGLSPSFTVAVDRIGACCCLLRILGPRPAPA